MYRTLFVALLCLLAACAQAPTPSTPDAQQPGSPPLDVGDLVSISLAAPEISARGSLETQGVPTDASGNSSLASVKVQITNAGLNSGNPLTFDFDSAGNRYIVSEDNTGSLDTLTLTQSNDNLSILLFPSTGLGAQGNYAFTSKGVDSSDVMLAYEKQENLAINAGSTVDIQLQTLIDSASIQKLLPVNYLIPGQSLELMLRNVFTVDGSSRVPFEDFTVSYDFTNADSDTTGTESDSSKLGVALDVSSATTIDVFRATVTLSGIVASGSEAVAGTVNTEIEIPFFSTTGLTADLEVPSLTFVQPSLQVNTAVTLSGTADDNAGISTMQVYRGPILIGSTDVSEYSAVGVSEIVFSGTNWSMPFTATQEIDYAFTAVATDASGNDNVVAHTVTAFSSPASLVSVSPSENAHAVALNSDITATFDQSMNTATASTMVVHSGKGQMLAADGVFTGTSFNPAADFMAGEEVQVTLTTGLTASSGLAIANPYVYKFRAVTSSTAGDGTSWAQSDLRPSGVASNFVGLRDLDDDGDIDVVEGTVSGINQVCLNNAGTYACTDLGATAGDTRDIEFGDVDGDGDTDIVVANNTAVNQLCLNNSSVFSCAALSADVNDSFASDFGDVDGDGDLDLVIANRGQADKLCTNDGAGVFSCSDLGVAASYYSDEAHFEDLDNDGDLDIFIITGVLFGANHNQECMNDGAGNFSCADSEVNTWVFDFASSDLDNDGDIDLFLPVNGGTNKVCLNDGSAAFSCADVNASTNQSRRVELGDLDGDGDIDAVVVNVNVGPGHQVCLNDGTASFSCSNLGINDTFYVSLADMDSDGDLDIVTGGYAVTDKVITNQ